MRDLFIHNGVENAGALGGALFSSAQSASSASIAVLTRIGDRGMRTDLNLLRSADARNLPGELSLPNGLHCK